MNKQLNIKQIKKKKKKELCAGLPSGSVVKNPPAMQEPQEMGVRSLGQEDPLEKGMAAHSRILAWRIPWTEESGGLQFIGLQRIGHNWSDLACMQELCAP